jgi:hypothetical protein
MTLNQTVARLKSLALSHKQIESFYYGPIVDFLQNGDVKYPACFIEHNSGTVSKTEKQTSHKFTVWFCDLVNVAQDAKGNDDEVESDLTSIAEDYFAMVSSTVYQDTWNVGEEVQLQYYQEKFEDLVGAVAFDLTIGTPFLSNRCQVPTTDNSFIES